MERAKAEYLARNLSRERPGDEIQVLTVEQHSAAAVRDRGQRRRGA